MQDADLSQPVITSPGICYGPGNPVNCTYRAEIRHPDGTYDAVECDDLAEAVEGARWLAGLREKFNAKQVKCFDAGPVPKQQPFSGIFVPPCSG